MRCIKTRPLAFRHVRRVLAKGVGLRLAPRIGRHVRHYHSCLSQGVRARDRPLCNVAANFNSLYGGGVSPSRLDALRRGLIGDRTYDIKSRIDPIVIHLVVLLGTRTLSLKRDNIRIVAIRHVLSFFGGSILPVICSQNSLKTSNSLTPLTGLFLPLVKIKSICCGKGGERTVDILSRFT